MKKVILSALMITTIISSALSQVEKTKNTSEINSPNFLVHNQLTPEFLKVEYAGGLSSGTLKNGDQTVNQFKQNTFTVSGYPVTLINRGEQQAYIGFGYTQDKYSSENTGNNSSFSDQAFHSMNVNFFMNTKIKGKFYWSSYTQIGVQGSNPFENVNHSFNSVLMNKINFKAKRNMNVGLGVVYASNLGKPLILPSIAFAYSTKHYLINIDFPVKAEVEGIFAQGQWRPVVGVAFPANTYHAKNANEYFSTSGMTGYVGMRYRVLDMLYIYAAWQTGLGETFKYGDRNDRKEIGTFNGQDRFVVSASIQIARLIPVGKN